MRGGGAAPAGAGRPRRGGGARHRLPWSRRGARVALTGPSGSGKSTLLHLMAGLDTPDQRQRSAGRVSATGRAWPTGPGRGGVPGPEPDPALDVLENVALPLLLPACSTPTREPAAAAALDRLGVGDLAAASCPRSCRAGRPSGSRVARVLAARPGADPGRRAHRPARPRHRRPGDRRAARRRRRARRRAGGGHPRPGGRRTAGRRGRWPTALLPRRDRRVGSRPGPERRDDRAVVARAGPAPDAAGCSPPRPGSRSRWRCWPVWASSWPRAGHHDRPRRPAVAVDWQVQVAARRRPARCSTRSRTAAGTTAATAGAASRTADGLAAHRAAARPRPPGRGVRARPARRLPRTLSPGELRTLAGRRHRGPACPADRRQPARPPGDTITIDPSAGRPRRCRVDGVVDLPRRTRCSRRSAPRPAPSRRRRRTTSCCCPRRRFSQLCTQRQRGRVTTQIHVARAAPPARRPGCRLHSRSPAPRATSRRALAGAGLVGDNLGAALDAARSDAAYAQCCSCSSGCPARCSPRCSPPPSPPPVPSGAAASRPCCALAAPPPARSCAWPRSRPPPSASSARQSGSALPR